MSTYEATDVTIVGDGSVGPALSLSHAVALSTILYILVASGQIGLYMTDGSGTSAVTEIDLGSISLGPDLSSAFSVISSSKSNQTGATSYLPNHTGMLANDGNIVCHDADVVTHDGEIVLNFFA